MIDLIIKINEMELARKVFLWFSILFLSASWLVMIHERTVESGYQQYGITPLVDILTYIVEFGFVIAWFMLYLLFDLMEIASKKSEEKEKRARFKKKGR